MAIIRQQSASAETEEPTLLLRVNNGDLEALRELTDRLGFKDEESVFRFALAVLSQSATRNLSITKIDGQRATLQPSPSLLKPEGTPTPTP